MKTQAEQLREELARILEEQAQKSPSLPPEFPKELIDRVVQYIVEQRQKGKTVAQCAQELGVPKGRMQYWLYQRGQRVGMLPPPPVLRPVQVASEMVHVYDGVPERRYTLRSPAGWELRDLTLSELVELLRSLA
jgi:hypothetical protein